MTRVDAKSQVMKMEQFPSYGVCHIGVPSYLHGNLLPFYTALNNLIIMDIDVFRF